MFLCGTNAPAFVDRKCIPHAAYHQIGPALWAAGVHLSSPHCRRYSPALALTLLDPKLDFSEAETAAGTQAGAVVGRADGSGTSPHDLRRLQASCADEAVRRVVCGRFLGTLRADNLSVHLRCLTNPPVDLRPQAYSNNLVDHHLVLDLLPGLAGAYFAGRLPVSLTYGQVRVRVWLP
jgi:N-acetyltransferase 10